MPQGRDSRKQRARLRRQSRRQSVGGCSIKSLPTLEQLERRQLLAGDLLSEPVVDTTPAVISLPTGSSIASQTGVSHDDNALPVVGQAEGESVADLVQFAKDLDAAGVIFYGAEWCPACSNQKALFEDGAELLPFVEVTNPDRSAGQIAIDNNITQYPTWEFPDTTRATGVLTLDEISTRSGVAIPVSQSPIFKDIGDQTVLIESPLHIPIDGYDPNGDPLSVTVTVADPSLLEATVLTGNRSIRIDMETYGDMVFELYEQRAPAASGRVIELAESGFYDDIIFHRLVDNFVIQGGDPTGTGSSGSNLGNFDDDFHPDLQHNRSGVLSFAKSSDDTNNSQFFITEVPTRFLDYNHSVFGQIVEGDYVREAISEHAINGSDRPTTDIAINTIEVFDDTENSVIMLKATGAGVGSTDVTVTLSDGDGNTFSETFQVDVNNDTANSQPYLNPITPAANYPNTQPAELQLSSTDIEGDALTYTATVVSGSSNATASISQDGLLTVTPANNFEGTVTVQAVVRPGPGVVGNSNSDFDSQLFTFEFEGEQTLATPTGLDLLAQSDSGESDVDNTTRDGSLQFVVEGVTAGATVQLVNVATSTVIGQAVASGSTVTITTTNIAALGDGSYNLAARQIDGNAVSDLSTNLALTYDSTAPESSAASAVKTANVGQQYQTDLINAEEGAITYSLSQSPSGATIDPSTGVITWTPTQADVGDQTFTVDIADIAGNVQTDTFTVAVGEEAIVEIRLELTDLNGNAISQVNVGDEFLLRMVAVDSRPIAAQRQGVFSAYADILFDANIIQAANGATIEFSDDFGIVRSGTLSSGLINELGAATSNITPSFEEEALIASLRMQAVAAGQVNVMAESADSDGAEVLLYGLNNEVLPAEIFYNSVTLNVGADFTANDDSVTVDEDASATTIDVLGNDVINGSGSLSVISVTQPAEGGSVTLSNGTVSFTPAAEFFGSTEFTYRVGDGSGAQDIATVTVTVTPQNDPPTGVGDTFNVDADSTDNVLDVLANDLSDPDETETLTVVAVGSTSEGGTVTISNNDDAVLYTPPANFTGTDTFTYTVSDGSLTEDVSVTVTVASADNAPTAVTDAFTLDEDTAETAYDVLQNDQQDVDSQSFLIQHVGVPSEGGSVNVSNDGLTFFYEPATDFFGTETVVYTIRDTGGGLSAATITFTVEAVNDAPPVLDKNMQLSSGASQSVVLQQSELPDNVDGDSEALTLAVVTNTSAGGTASVNGNGEIVYTPPSDTFTGTDTISYTVEDADGAVSTGTITVVVEDFTTRSIRIALYDQQAGLINATVRLTGQDSVGNDVDLEASQDGNTLLFADVLPGQYEVTIPALPFLIGGEEPQVFQIDSAPEDGDVELEANLGKLHPAYISIRDFLGSRPRQSLLVAVRLGEDAVLVQPSAQSSQSITQASVSLSSDAGNLSIRGRNGDGQDSATLTGNADTSETDIVSPRGQVGELRLYRVNVDSEVISYNVDTDSAGSTGAEGEQVSSLTLDGAGEGEQAINVPVETENDPEDADVDPIDGTLLLNDALSGEGEAVAEAGSETDSSDANRSSDDADESSTGDAEDVSEAEPSGGSFWARALDKLRGQV